MKKQKSGRVTILPKQVRRLAALSTVHDTAIEIVQDGSILQFNNGHNKFSVDASGTDVDDHPNQEKLC